MRSAWIALLFLSLPILLTSKANAQQPEAAAPSAPAAAPAASQPNPAGQANVSPFPTDLQAIISKQFGPCFKLSMQQSVAQMHYKHPQPDEAPWVNFMEEDLDRDGSVDAIIVARCKNPMANAVAYEYKVSDPYFAYNGFGDPKITAGFASEDPTAGNLILIIHGSGKEGWRAEKPKAKFVIINLPFQSLAISKIMLHKKPVPAVALLEGEDLSSALFWDGRKYRWSDTSGH